MSFCCDQKFFQKILLNPDNYSEELQKKAFDEIKNERFNECMFCKTLNNCTQSDLTEDTENTNEMIQKINNHLGLNTSQS